MQLPGEFFPFIEKKVVFCLVVGGVTPPPLSGPTTKKTTFFMCVFPNSQIAKWENVRNIHNTQGGFP